MLTVPNLQATGVLAFLQTALNGDPELIAVVGSPVIGAVAEHEPVTPGGASLEVYTTELPALGYVVKASIPLSNACADGYQDDVDLVLVTGIPQAQVIDGVAVVGTALARRWLAIVAERAVYWLGKQKFPHDAAYASVADYFEQFGIDSIEVKRLGYSIQGSWAVARLGVGVTRYLPSYSLAAHAVQLTDLTAVSGSLVQSFYAGAVLLGNVHVDLEETIAP
jgi:hypothetical protein